MTSFYSEDELRNLGLGAFGKSVFISRKCSLYDVSHIYIGNNVRIDDFCILSGKITIGSNIHISAYSALFGARGIVMEDNTGISQRCTLISATDDFSGDYFVGPIHDSERTHVTGGPIVIKQYAHVCAHCLILPNVTLAEGCVIGAMSMVRHSTEAWWMYVGIPIKKLKRRKETIKTQENKKL